MLSADQLKGKEKEKEANKEAPGVPDDYVEKLNLPAELARLQDIRKIRVAEHRAEYLKTREAAIASEKAWREERRRDVEAQDAMAWEVAGDLLRKLGHPEPAQEAARETEDGEAESKEAEDKKAKE